MFDDVFNRISCCFVSVIGQQVFNQVEQLILEAVHRHIRNQRKQKDDGGEQGEKETECERLRPCFDSASLNPGKKEISYIINRQVIKSRKRYIFCIGNEGSNRR